MGAMENMMASMLQKAIPPDVMAMMTPEKIQEYKDNVNAIWTAHKEQLDRIESKQCEILANIDELSEKLDGPGKRDGDSRGSSGRNRSRSGNVRNGSAD